MANVVVGDLLDDRYQLVEIISSTLMSKVFKAWDDERKCFVAVKITANTPEHPNLRSCLEREASALLLVNHPRVVRLLDSGYIGKSLDKSYYIVLEYFRGINLGVCLENEYPLPLDVAGEVALEMLEGLEAIHQAGLIHRDFKPENLMITPDGVKIIDLGLVKFVNESVQVTRRLDKPGMTLGTLPYVSPEQMYNHNDLNCRCDIYACGVILYEVLTGLYPFLHKNFIENGVTVEYWKNPLRQFSEILPPVDIPDAIQAIAWKALQVEPDDRYQTAVEMRTALLKASNQTSSKTKIKQYLEKFWKDPVG